METNYQTLENSRFENEVIQMELTSCTDTFQNRLPILYNSDSSNIMSKNEVISLSNNKDMLPIIIESLNNFHKIYFRNTTVSVYISRLTKPNHSVFDEIFYKFENYFQLISKDIFTSNFQNRMDIIKWEVEFFGEKEAELARKSQIFLYFQNLILNIYLKYKLLRYLKCNFERQLIKNPHSNQIEILKELLLKFRNLNHTRIYNFKSLRLFSIIYNRLMQNALKNLLFMYYGFILSLIKINRFNLLKDQFFTIKNLNRIYYE